MQSTVSIMAHSGGCLCGGVRYEVHGPLAQPVACHCSQCARTSGNYMVAASCRSADLHLTASDMLVWFQSSAKAQRGFCSRCGGNVFWRAMASELTYVTAGTLDPPTGLHITEHIYVASKADFYDITDGLPQKAEW